MPTLWKNKSATISDEFKSVIPPKAWGAHTPTLDQLSLLFGNARVFRDP